MENSLKTSLKGPISEMKSLPCGMCGHLTCLHLLPVFKENIDISVSEGLKVEVPIFFWVTYLCMECGALTTMKTLDHEFIKAYLDWYETKM